MLQSGVLKGFLSHEDARKFLPTVDQQLLASVTVLRFDGSSLAGDVGVLRAATPRAFRAIGTREGGEFRGNIFLQRPLRKNMSP